MASITPKILPIIVKKKIYKYFDLIISFLVKGNDKKYLSEFA